MDFEPRAGSNAASEGILRPYHKPAAETKPGGGSSFLSSLFKRSNAGDEINKKWQQVTL